MERLTLEDLTAEEIRGRRVLVRVDYNVPLDERQEVVDDTRIRATIPTLQRLIEFGARIILLSHFGRPKGQRVPEMSLRPAARRLSEILHQKVDFIGSTTGSEPLEASRQLQDGEVLLLENTRYDPREEANDIAMGKELAQLGELFVNDAFGTAHRAHASTAAVASEIRTGSGLAVAGLLMKRELDYLGSALQNPERPFVAILGGAKISGKIDVIEALLPKTDHLLIGGAMANTFFRAQGLQTGSSLVEEDRVSMAKSLLERASDKLILPVDVVIAPSMEAGAEAQVVAATDIPADQMALDIGPATVEKYAKIVRAGRTVLWNGPMGVSEIPAFRGGTEGVARALAEATKDGAVTVVGGGDSAAALHDLGLQDDVAHVSTGGGASLEFLEGRSLPGVEALSPQREK